MKSSITRRRFLVDSGAAVVGASALGTFLAACGGTSPTSTSSAPVTLSYWCLFYAAGTPSGSIIDSAVQNFERTHKGVTIDVTGWSGDQAGLTKLTQALHSGNTVDLFRVSADELPAMVQQGLVAPTDNFLDASDKSDIFPNILKNVTINGKVYAWPMYVPPVAMYLNLDIFKEKNITPPSGTWTYDQFLQMAQQLTFTRSDGTKVYGFTGVLDAGVVNLWPIIMGDGGAPLSPDNKTYTFNNAESISGVQKLVDLAHKYKVTPPDFGTQTTADIRSGFTDRKAYAMYCEPSGFASTLAVTKGFNFAIMPMPIGGRGTNFTCGGIGLVAVANLQDQDRLGKAMAVAKYLSSSQIEQDTPGYYTAPPVRKSVQVGAPTSDFIPMIPYTWLAPMIAQWDAVRLLIQTALQNAVLGKADPKTAMDAIASQVNSLLSQGS